MTVRTYTAQDIKKALLQKDTSGLSFPSKMYQSAENGAIIDFIRQELDQNDVVKVVIDDDSNLMNLMVP